MRSCWCSSLACCSTRCSGLLPLRFLSFGLVGALGVLVHLAVLSVVLKLGGLDFELAQAVATGVAMGFNFQLNNEITYRDQRLRGPRLWRGLLLFMLVCGLGAVTNVGIAKTLYDTNTSWSIAGAVGALIGPVRGAPPRLRCPPDVNVCCHRPTEVRLTLSRRATSAGRTPRCNSLPASMRLASNSDRSRRFDIKHPTLRKSVRNHVGIVIVAP